MIEMSEEIKNSMEAFAFTYALSVIDEAATIFGEIGIGTAPDILRGDIVEINRHLRKLRTKAIKFLHESKLSIEPK